jgi:hypothetical protein
MYRFRDPRAIAASLWNLRSKREPLPKLRGADYTAQRWRRDIARFVSTYNSVIKTIREQRNSTTVTFFEDLVENPQEVFAEMAVICGLHVPASTLTRAVTIVNFENLRGYDLRHVMPMLSRIKRINPEDPRTHHYYDGTRSVYKELVDSESRSWADGYLLEHLDPFFKRYYVEPA